MTKADNAGLDPKAVRPERIPNMDMVFDLAWQMTWTVWPHRPGRGGNCQHDTVGRAGRAI